MIMKTDELGIPRFTNKDLIDMIYTGHIDKCHVVLCDPSDDIDKFNLLLPFKFGLFSSRDTKYKLLLFTYSKELRSILLSSSPIVGMMNNEIVPNLSVAPTGLKLSPIFSANE